MQTVHFPHGYHFDPTYGYTLDSLLTVAVPEEPTDFAKFWENLRDQADAVQLAPARYEIDSPDPRLRIFHVEYSSLHNFRIHGWLTIPRHDPIERGVVVGHGYGGRDWPDLNLPMTKAAAIFPCARGISRSTHHSVPANPLDHVLHGIDDRHRYVHGACVADLWCAASALIRLFPTAANRLDYLGVSFGGGIGALALPWDERFHGAHLCVPSFGNHPLRLTLPCIGSGEAVRGYSHHHPTVLETLRYFDAATAARRIQIPVHVAPALFDPAVPPPGQFAIYNGLSGAKELLVLQAGHFDYPDRVAEEQRLLETLARFFAID